MRRENKPGSTERSSTRDQGVKALTAAAWLAKVRMAAIAMAMEDKATLAILLRIWEELPKELLKVQHPTLTQVWAT